MGVNGRAVEPLITPFPMGIREVLWVNRPGSAPARQPSNWKRQGGGPQPPRMGRSGSQPRLVQGRQQQVQQQQPQVQQQQVRPAGGGSAEALRRAEILRRFGQARGRYGTLGDEDDGPLGFEWQKIEPKVAVAAAAT